MVLSVPEPLLTAIRRHAEAAYPEECCGFLLGTGDGARRVRDVLPAANVREEGARRHRFLIPPEAYLRGEENARSRGLEIVGFYHSHPDAPGEPSEYDRLHAWPWFSYLILEVRGGKVVGANGWRLSDDRRRFEAERLEVEGSEPSLSQGDLGPEGTTKREETWLQES